MSNKFAFAGVRLIPVYYRSVWQADGESLEASGGRPEDRCVIPSFIRAIRASGSASLTHSSFVSRLPLRLRSIRIRSSTVGVVMPLSWAIRVSIAW